MYSNVYDYKKFLSKQWLLGFGYVLSIIFGNLLVVYFGIIHFMGLVFPAGALAIGLTFSLRDFVQREFGHRVWYFMIFSTIITALLSFVLADMPIPAWKVALASAVAFIVSEFVDWLVYTITKWDFTLRIVISNLFSTPVDSILFVGIAFGVFNFFEPPVYGQSIVKYLSGLLVLPFIFYMRYRVRKSIK
jgi:queuosine precursor transporter